MKKALLNSKSIHIQQFPSLFELTRKYRVFDNDFKEIGIAAYERDYEDHGFKNLFGLFSPIKATIFNNFKLPEYFLEFDKKFLLTNVLVLDTMMNPIGCIQERYLLFGKKFNLLNKNGEIVGQINCPLFRRWTFDIYKDSYQISLIQKKWGGVLRETFTDADNFEIKFLDPSMTLESRALIIAACLMIDSFYFKKSGLWKLLRPLRDE